MMMPMTVRVMMIAMVPVLLTMMAPVAMMASLLLQ